MDVQYRLAEREDLAKLLSLYGQLNPDDPAPQSAKAEAVWDAMEKNDCIRCFIATVGSNVVASCTVTVIPNLTRDCRPYAVIENVITDVDYRRMGIGERVVMDATGFAREQNCFKVMLMSSVKRKVAHRFYAAIGFDGNSKKSFELRLL